MEFQEFVNQYYQRYIQALNEFDRSTMDGVLEVFMNVAESGGTLWVAGNGGSAAISDHTVCDATKLCHVEGFPTVKTISLTSNTAMLTALGNDYSYDVVFSKQLEYYLEDNDAVLLVSSSGNSPNVVKACEYANERGIPTLAFTGFKGGKLKDIAKYCVWIPVDNYGMAEDAHQSLMHVTTQFIQRTWMEKQAQLKS